MVGNRLLGELILKLLIEYPRFLVRLYSSFRSWDLTEIILISRSYDLGFFRNHPSDVVVLRSDRR